MHTGNDIHTCSRNSQTRSARGSLPSFSIIKTSPATRPVLHDSSRTRTSAVFRLVFEQFRRNCCSVASYSVAAQPNNTSVAHTLAVIMGGVVSQLMGDEVPIAHVRDLQCGDLVLVRMGAHTEYGQLDSCVINHASQHARTGRLRTRKLSTSAWNFAGIICVRKGEQWLLAGSVQKPLALPAGPFIWSLQRAGATIAARRITMNQPGIGWVHASQQLSPLTNALLHAITDGSTWADIVTEGVHSSERASVIKILSAVGGRIQTEMGLRSRPGDSPKGARSGTAGPSSPLAVAPLSPRSNEDITALAAGEFVACVYEVAGFLPARKYNAGDGVGSPVSPGGAGLLALPQAQLDTAISVMPVTPARAGLTTSAHAANAMSSPRIAPAPQTPSTSKMSILAKSLRSSSSKDDDTGIMYLPRDFGTGTSPMRLPWTAQVKLEPEARVDPGDVRTQIADAQKQALAAAIAGAG